MTTFLSCVIQCVLLFFFWDFWVRIKKANEEFQTFYASRLLGKSSSVGSAGQCTFQNHRVMFKGFGFGKKKDQPAASQEEGPDSAGSPGQSDASEAAGSSESAGSAVKDDSDATAVKEASDSPDKDLPASTPVKGAEADAAETPTSTSRFKFGFSSSKKTPVPATPSTYEKDSLDAAGAAPSTAESGEKRRFGGLGGLFSSKKAAKEPSTPIKEDASADNSNDTDANSTANQNDGGVPPGQENSASASKAAVEGQLDTINENAPLQEGGGSATKDTVGDNSNAEESDSGTETKKQRGRAGRKAARLEKNTSSSESERSPSENNSEDERITPQSGAKEAPAQSPDRAVDDIKRMQRSSPTKSDSGLAEKDNAATGLDATEEEEVDVLVVIEHFKSCLQRALGDEVYTQFIEVCTSLDEQSSTAGLSGQLELDQFLQVVAAFNV